MKLLSVIFCQEDHDTFYVLVLSGNSMVFMKRYHPHILYKVNRSSVHSVQYI